MTTRRRLLGGAFDIPDAEIPEAWKAKETITDSWHTVIKNCENGSYKEKYKIGDTKVANFGAEGLAVMRLVGFDCDELASGGYACTSWIPEHCLKTLTYWNYPPSKGTEGGYAASTLKEKIDAVFLLLPEVLQQNIKEVKKTCMQQNGVDQTVDVKVWPPSYRELGGYSLGDAPDTSSTSGEEKSGPYYSNPPRCTRRTGDTPNGSVKTSWLRSVSYHGGASGGCAHETAKSSTGALNSAPWVYNESLGVMPGFCI